jgi:prephenate dehydrogenase
VELTLKDARIVIVGLGLMGGSLGLALKKYEVCREVVGLVRRDEAIREAEKLGVVDSATTQPSVALPEADIVVFGTPIRTIVRQLADLAGYYKPEAIITDMGSTKQEIVQAMATLPAGIQPLGSHPMCGKEKAGMAAAEATLFQEATWVLTPLERTTPEAIQVVQDMAQAIGAKVQTLAARRHDKLVATISHLPYTLAATLTLTAKDVAEDDPTVWEVAASGFRDTSRVAASDETMMLDILLTNQQEVGHRLAEARAQLDRFATALAAGDEEALRMLMKSAAEQRRLLFQ